MNSVVQERERKKEEEIIVSLKKKEEKLKWIGREEKETACQTSSRGEEARTAAAAARMQWS